MTTDSPEAIGRERMTAAPGPDTGLDADSLVTPFEAWCEARGIHPESALAWVSYRQSLGLPPA